MRQCRRAREREKGGIEATRRGEGEREKEMTGSSVPPRALGVPVHTGIPLLRWENDPGDSDYREADLHSIITPDY